MEDKQYPITVKELKEMLVSIAKLALSETDPIIENEFYAFVLSHKPVQTNPKICCLDCQDTLCDDCKNQICIEPELEKLNEDKIREIIEPVFVRITEVGVKNKDIEVATIATSLEQSLHTLFDYLSNPISNDTNKLDRDKVLVELKEFFNETGLIANVEQDQLEDLTDTISNLISNQDKIDCYSKTGEVISNDKGEVIAGRVYVDSEDVWITIAQIDHIGASYHLGNKASSPFGKYKGKNITISISINRE